MGNIILQDLLTVGYRFNITVFDPLVPGQGSEMPQAVLCGPDADVVWDGANQLVLKALEMYRGGRRDSNPRRPEPQSGALPS